MASWKELNLAGSVLKSFRGQSEWACIVSINIHKYPWEKRHNMHKSECIKEVTNSEGWSRELGQGKDGKDFPDHAVQFES